MFNILTFADHPTAIKVISVITILCLVLAIIVIVRFSNKFTTRTIVLSSIFVACSFVLSINSINIGLFGGSITLASFVPIVLFSFIAGLAPGLLCGLVFGLLQFMYDPMIFTAWTFILDYILAFMSIGLAGIFGKMKNKSLGIIIAIIVVYLSRLTFATISGILYFNAGWVSEGIPTPNAFVYSLLYNMIYIVPDMLICIVVFVIMIVTKALPRILKVFNMSYNTPPKTEQSKAEPTVSE